MVDVRVVTRGVEGLVLLSVVLEVKGVFLDEDDDASEMWPGGLRHCVDGWQ